MISLNIPRRVRRVTALCVLLVVSAALSSCSAPDSSPSLNGVVRDTPLDVSGLSLRDVTIETRIGGAPVVDGALELRAAPDRLLLVYFGFTNCPDVCPTTLTDLKIALRALEQDDRDRIDIAFITVDPDRDTADLMNRYMEHFFERFHVVRDDAQAVTAVADRFLASFSVESVDGDVQVAHTAVLYAVDTSGKVVIEWPFGTSGPAMAEDLGKLLAGADDAAR